MAHRYDSGTRWEAAIGYSRAIRRGPYVAVSGTTAVNAAGEVQASDAGGQARYVFAKIADSLEQVGASLRDVVRTRMYVTSADHVDAVTEAHYRAMRGVRPAATLVIVAGLIDPALVVEIEADAYVVE